MNVDADANDVEVIFMYPSAKKHDNFSLGNAGPVWCSAETIINDYVKDGGPGAV